MIPALPAGLVPYQVGVVVADLDASMARYSRLLGLSGWKRMDTDYVARYRDWEGRIANHNAFAPWGPIHLEMIEPGIGEGNAKVRAEGLTGNQPHSSRSAKVSRPPGSSTATPP